MIIRNAASYRQLSDERQLYDHDYQQWEKRATKVEAILDGYYATDQHIQSTVAVQHQSLIVEKGSVHEKLRALSSCFAVNPYYRIHQLFQRWQSLIKTPTNLQQWVAEWDSFLVEAKDTGRPGVESKTYDWEPIFGFIDAIRPIEPTFAEQTEHDLQNNGNLTIHEIIGQYRGHFHGGQGSGNSIKASFATLGGMQSQPTKKPSDCPCGEKHYFSQCSYVNEKIRRPDWQPQPDIRQRFKDIRKNSPKLLTAINRARMKAGLDEWNEHDEDAHEVHFAETLGVSFIPKVYMPSKPMPVFEKDTYILDSGATTYVCNDRHQFTEFKVNDWMAPSWRLWAMDKGNREDSDLP